MKFLTKHLYTIIGIFMGALAGFAYWKFIGCASGTCPITSKPLNSTIYGAVMGALMLNIIKDFKLKKDEN